MSKTRSDLYKLARVLGDAEAVYKTVKTGNPRYVARRVVNKSIGRIIPWHLLWGGRR